MKIFTVRVNSPTSVTIAVKGMFGLRTARARMILINKVEVDEFGWPIVSARVQFLIDALISDDNRLVEVMKKMVSFSRHQEVMEYFYRMDMKGLRLFIYLKTQYQGSLIAMVRDVLKHVDRNNADCGRILE